MIDKNLFFNQYQLNYFNYKQNSLEILLKKKPPAKLKHQIFGFDEEEYKLSIQCDIRQTYFQALETVFELFFVLSPDINGIFSEEIIEKLSTSGFSYDKIKSIYENEKYLDYLNNTVHYPDKTKSKVGEFIFYFGIYKFEKYKPLIPESINAIKFALRCLAEEFQDRREYNCYKHGLRIIPALKNISFHDPASWENILGENVKFNLDNSMSFYSYDKKTNITEWITKKFDTNRDIRMTKLCSNLIWNMIKSKAVAFNRGKHKPDAKIEVMFFGIDEIKKAMKRNHNFSEFIVEYK